MSCIIRVYGDEAGTMPANDNDDIFIAGTFALVGDVPDTLPDQRSNPEWTVSHLKTIHAVPSCTLVNPGPGYGLRLAKKVDGINHMARETKLKTGRNSRYVPEGGFSARNLVWGYAMEIALGTNVPMLILRAGCVPDRVEIFLDEKTMPDEMRHLFRTKAREFGVTAKQSILGMAAAATGKGRELLEAFAEATAVTPDLVTVQWSDEPGFTGNQKGLELADSLTSNLFKELRKTNPLPGFRKLLDDAGCHNYLLDITERIISPPPANIVQKWVETIGLPSPF